MNNNLIIVGFGKARELALKTIAQRTDIKSILIDSYTNRGFAPLFDQTIFIEDLTDFQQIWNAVSSKVDLKEIVGVITFVEHLVPTTVKLANKLNLPSMQLEAAMSARDKFVMRKNIDGTDINQPVFNYIENKEDSSLVSIKDFPGVIKPIDMAGSIGVKKIEQKSDLVNYFLNSPNYNSNGFLYESFIDGKEFSAEGYVQNGDVNLICYTEKEVNDTEGFIEIGHILPYNFNLDLKNYINQEVIKVIKKLNLNNCAFHLEFKLTSDNDFYFIEVGARPAGDYVCNLIYQAIGINFYDLLIDVAIAKDVNITYSGNFKYSAIKYMLGDEKIENLDNISSNVININLVKKSGLKMQTPKSNIDRKGYIHIIGNSYEEVKEDMKKLTRS